MDPRPPPPGVVPQTLPPIHTVLGDQLRLPASVSHSPHSSSSYASFYTCEDGGDTSPEPTGSSSNRWSMNKRQRAFTIPLPPLVTPSPGLHPPFPPKTYSLPATPVPSGSPKDSESREGSGVSLAPILRKQPKSVGGAGSEPQAQVPAAPSFSYSILRPSPSGELITAPQIKRGRRQKKNSAQGAAGQSSVSQRRHVCSICQKTFNRPSSLQTHLSVHTGSRPYECLHPTCTKVFSVASNMRRHFRKHHTHHQQQHHQHHSGTTLLAVRDVAQQTLSRNDESLASSDGDGDGDGGDGGDDDASQMEMDVDSTHQEGGQSSSSLIVLPRLSAEHHRDARSAQDEEQLHHGRWLY